MSEVKGELATFQAGLLNIGSILSLHLGLKSSSEKKLEKIFMTFKEQDVKSDRFYEFLEHIIDSCKCDEYTHTRLSSYERIVRKTTHPKSNIERI